MWPALQHARRVSLSNSMARKDRLKTQLEPIRAPCNWFKRFKLNRSLLTITQLTHLNRRNFEQKSLEEANHGQSDTLFSNTSIVQFGDIVWSVHSCRTTTLQIVLTILSTVYDFNWNIVNVR